MLSKKLYRRDGCIACGGKAPGKFRRRKKEPREAKTELQPRDYFFIARKKEVIIINDT
jgi:hypothetical protein